MAAEVAASLRLRVAAVEPEIGRSRVWQWIGAVREENGSDGTRTRDLRRDSSFESLYGL